jgi:hypothetical protein
MRRVPSNDTLTNRFVVGIGGRIVLGRVFLVSIVVDASYPEMIDAAKTVHSNMYARRYGGPVVERKLNPVSLRRHSGKLEDSDE